MQNILFVIKTLFSKGRENQSFIGAWWIVVLLKATPKVFKRRVALTVLSWSPHYFYQHIDNSYATLTRKEFLEAEFTRNKTSRKKIKELLLHPFLGSSQTVLDYGCGPGFLAHCVSSSVENVIAVDLSRGVLECAKNLNSNVNISYMHVSELSSVSQQSVDVIYSFAVIQHVTDDVFESILREAYHLLVKGGKLVLHVVVDEKGWQNESAWRSDKSLKGKVKLEYGLNCFNRRSNDVVELVENTGFSSVSLMPIKSLCDQSFDDVCDQHLLVADKL